MERMKRYALGIAWAVIGVAFSVSLTFGAYSLGNDASGAPTLAREIQSVARPKQQVVKTSPASGGGTPIPQPGLPATAGAPVSAPQGSFGVDGQGDPVSGSWSSNSGTGSSNSGQGSSNSGSGSSDFDQSENPGSDDDDDDRDSGGSGGGDD